MNPQTKKYLKIQKEMRKEISLENGFNEITKVGGVDQAFIGDSVLSSIVTLRYPSLELIEEKTSTKEAEIPYIPGFLSFREGPSIEEAYEKLDKKPDVLIVDGHGIAHPRRMGIATHVGIKLNQPTIGVAKKKLVGSYQGVKEVGQASPLVHEGETIGYVYKSKKGCNPLFVSPGHLVDFETSLDVVRNTLAGYKLPEPTRLADRYVDEYKKEVISNG